MPDPAQPLGRIDVSQLIGQAPPAVNPSAVEQLVDAFHKGFVTTDDIHSRLEQAPVNTAKRKVEIQAATEAMTPEAIAARQAQTAAAGTQATEFGSPAQVEARKTGAEATTAKGKAEIKAVTYPYAVAYDALAPKARSEGAQFPEPGEDLALKNTIGYALTHWNSEQTAAHEDLKRYGMVEGVDASGKKVLLPTKDKIPISVDAFRAAQAKADKPFQFIPPGAVTSPTTPAAPFATPENPAPMIVPPAAPFAAPEVPAPMIVPNTPVAGATVPLPTSAITPLPPSEQRPEMGAPFASGFYMGETTKQPKAFTETQSKALNAMARAVSVQPTFDALEKKGFDPAAVGAALRMKAIKSGTLGQLATTAIPGPTKITPDERSYAAASNTWIQGILRVESGAAISKKEQVWYEDTFFPIMGDTPEVQQQKSIARKSATRSLEEVITGNHTPEEYDKFHKDIENIAAGIGAPVPPPAGTGPAAAAATPYDNIPEYNSPDEGAAATKPGQRYKVKGQKGTWLKH